MSVTFSQDDVNDIKKFIQIADLFGFSVRVTGGVFKPYDIACSNDDFSAINEMAN